MNKPDPKTNLLEHSEAKIKLYGRYLSIYLNILHRVSSVKKVFIFDLFCGEGIYENGVKGSPIIAREIIKNHYFDNKMEIPNISIWFNDNGMSEIEPGKSKVDRVAEASSKIFWPPKLEIEYFKEDYEVIYPRAIDVVQQKKDAKGFFFLDPFGYKSIKPEDIKKMLKGGQNEVLLWLPIAQMYRFAESVMVSAFPGSEPLKNFLVELFGDHIPVFTCPDDFIEQLKSRFRVYLKNLGIFVDGFTLARDATNVYCLFFFTSSMTGCEKMLEAKWHVDKQSGKGFTLEKTQSLFSEIELSQYPQKVRSFLESSNYRSNFELYEFGLKNGFLPKHTKKVLDDIKAKAELELISFDDKPAKGYLIGNKDRRVGIRIIKNSPV